MRAGTKLANKRGDQAPLSFGGTVIAFPLTYTNRERPKYNPGRKIFQKSKAVKNDRVQILTCLGFVPSPMPLLSKHYSTSGRKLFKKVQKRRPAWQFSLSCRSYN